MLFQRSRLLVLKINAKLEGLNSMLSIEQMLCNDHQASKPFVLEKLNASSGLDLSVSYLSSLLFLFT